MFFNSYRARARRSSNGEEDHEGTQELEAYIDEAEEEGLFEPDEAEMVRQVVEFSDTVVREIMTPRVNMECIEIGMSLREFTTRAAQEKFSRYPVIEGKIDNVVGIAHIKSLLAFGADTLDEKGVAELMTPPHFVPESKKVSSLLRDLQANKVQMAIVVDEYGGTAGLITLEDILEEIVGEIEDEHDDTEEELEIRRNQDGSLNVSGTVDVSEVEKFLDVELDDKSYETVSGLALSHLKHIPKVGEKFVTKGGVEVEIIDADERNVFEVRLSKTENDE
jgi:CBS domain containing-hemolysin-like protein